MEYHDINLLLKLPTLQLLRAQNAPMLLGFLHQTFKREHKVVIPEGQLRASLTTYLDELRESDPLAYPKTAAEYLADWCSESHGFLRRYYGSDASEPQFELTIGSEKALLWLESLQEARFVGTESRLESIFTGLDEILKFASADPDERIRRLEKEADEIRAEIDRIRATGAVASFSPVQINERYAQILGTARELLSDFRQVEENFKRVAREIAERQTQPGVTKGAIVGHLLDSHDALRESEQGQSFFAFWNLLLSTDRQQQFQEQMDQVVGLEALNADHRGNHLLRRLISNLLREGEKVVESHQRMSTNLRRVLDTAHLNERRQVGELLQAIRNTALKLRDNPPTDEDFFHVEDFPEIFSAMSRPLWQAPASVTLSGGIENDDGELGLDELRGFRNLPQIRLEELRRNVAACLEREPTVTLQQVLDFSPPRHGMMEVAGYVIVAASDPHHYVGDDTQVLELPPPSRQRWRVPRVLFCKAS
ncbi:MAG TPA: DUF3375 domain-containing protein [Verrucomicrobiota bacterium]|nr:DUF3375 domain-containing protein [Verrucomicrobiota bacterium]